MRESHETLLASLTADLTPVRGLRSVASGISIWLFGCATLAVGALALFSGPADGWNSIALLPNTLVSAAAAATTAILSMIAALKLRAPDAAWRWSMLPLAPAVIWIGSSGLGCLVSDSGTPHGGLDCFATLLAFAIPLGCVASLILRRASSLYPMSLAMTAGLSCAAAAATLLALFHPFPSTAMDLAMHAAATCVIIAAIWFFG